jgi:hypothetical protein
LTHLAYSAIKGVIAAAAAALALAPASAAAAPGNDNFANAQAIGTGPVSKTVNGTTLGATSEPSEPHHLSYPAGDSVSVWYSWKAGSQPENVNIEACGDQNIEAGVAVYRGTGLGSLQRVALADYEYCQPAPSVGFKSAPGVTYRIAVTSDTDAIVQGPFALRFEATPVPVRDLSLAQTASRKQIDKGQTVTYTVRVTNRGNVPITNELGMISSKPFRLAQPVPETRYVRIHSTRGSCRRATLFAVHKGAICSFRNLPPGASLTVTAVVRLRESITHWVYFVNEDSNRANDGLKKNRVTTIVRS